MGTIDSASMNRRETNAAKSPRDNTQRSSVLIQATIAAYAHRRALMANFRLPVYYSAFKPDP